MVCVACAACAVELRRRCVQEQLQKCQEVIANDYFLGEVKDAFTEQARMAIFEVYCRIHQRINLDALAAQVRCPPRAAAAPPLRMQPSPCVAGLVVCLAACVNSSIMERGRVSGMARTHREWDSPAGLPDDRACVGLHEVKGLPQRIVGQPCRSRQTHPHSSTVLQEFGPMRAAAKFVASASQRPAQSAACACGR